MLHSHQVVHNITDPDGYKWGLGVYAKLGNIEVDPTNSKPGRAVVRWRATISAGMANETPKRANPVAAGFQYIVYLGFPKGSVFCAPDEGVPTKDASTCYRRFATFVHPEHADDGFMSPNHPTLEPDKGAIMSAAIYHTDGADQRFPTEPEEEYIDAWEVDLPEDLANQWKQARETLAAPKVLVTATRPGIPGQDQIENPCSNLDDKEVPVSPVRCDILN